MDTLLPFVRVGGDQGGGGVSVRRTAVGLVLAVLSTVLAVVAPGVAGAAVEGPTLDQDRFVFVVPGPHHLSGTFPGAGGQTVSAYLDNANLPTTTALPDGTWSLDITLGALADGEHEVVVTTPALGGGGYLSVLQFLWVAQDGTGVTVDAPGAPVTSLGADRCLPVTAHLSDPSSAWDTNASRAYLSDGAHLADAHLVPGADPSTLTACVPVAAVANGDDHLWVEIIPALGPVLPHLVSRVALPLQLTSSASLQASVLGGGERIDLAGTIDYPGPDTVVTLALDGVARPAPPVLPSPTAPFTYSVSDQVDVWDPVDRAKQLVPDGPHVWHASLTSRGVTTVLPDITVLVDTTAAVTIDGATVSSGTVHVMGTMANIPDTSPDRNLRVVVTHDGISPVVSYLTPARGQTAYDVSVDTPVLDAGQTVVTVTGHDRHGTWSSASVQVAADGALTPLTPPSRPRPPATVSVAGTGVADAVVTVTPPTGDGGAPVSGYTATLTSVPYGSLVGPSQVFTSVGATPTIALPGVAGIYDWQVEVRAVNAVGESLAVVTWLRGSSVGGTPPKTSVRLGSTISLGTYWTVNGGVAATTSARAQFRRSGSATWADAAAATITAGVYRTLVVTPRATGTWRVVVNGGTAFGGGVGPAFPVTVLGPPSLTFVESASTVRLGATVTFAGAISPSYAGRRVYLQRYSAGAWRSVTSTLVSATSRWSIRYRTTSRTDFRWRALVLATSTRPSGASRSLLLTVR